jgi:Domain of Unknown Function (DUF1080)
MRVAGRRSVCFLGAALAAAAIGVAEDKTDPRVGLKAGLTDAGQAALGMELIASLPKPPGFYDPKAPAGEPTPPEELEAKESETPPNAAPRPRRGRGRGERGGGGLNFANSDLAFRGTQLFVGNFSGYNAYDIANPKSPKLIASVVCPGGQGDVSVHGNLLFMSVEQTRGRLDCGGQGVEAPVSGERFRGVRIFDITDIRKPKQIAAVQTCRGSHTHTLLVDPDDHAHVYIYGSGTSSVRSPEELAGCSGMKPEEDPNTSLFSIDVIQVPLSAPAKARIVNRPRIFADLTTGNLAGLAQGRKEAPGIQATRQTNQCHDITVFPEIGLAAGACSGNGILLDISDPVNPVRLDAVEDTNFAYWHSATFNNDGTKVVFTDEWGGGTRPRCRATDPPNWGANAIFDIVDRKLTFRGYYKMPAPQTEQENCVAHNGSIIPVPGRDIMVQGWYQGGVSVFDFTDSAKPIEIAYFDRGPVEATRLVTGGQWSSYWYNGHVYGAEIARGLDVFRLTPGQHLTQNEIEAAAQVRQAAFNAQQQPRMAWPAQASVGRAYLDQLARNQAIGAERAAAVKAALARSASQNEALAAQLEQDASAAPAQDGLRLKGLAAVLRGQRVTGRQTASGSVEAGFTSLFNGKDLTGWKIAGPAESWSVKDGAIVANGRASHLYYDGPVHDHSFRNFELKVDAMTQPGSNGGVYVLTEFMERTWPGKGFEIQVNNSHTDRIRTGSLYHVQDVLDQSPAKDGEWFTEHIIVKGDTITVLVDGQQVVQWTQPADWDGGREGPGRKITGPGTIALQAHDPKSVVHYKNIRIKVLE